tara:strand:+ start:245 stop:574 length:330 start_codon:yes stop_codon:yes gene_type:complete
MNLETGRPDHINDWLASYRTGGWYGYTDNSNQIYANLIVLDGGSKPTESEVTAGLKAMQDKFDSQEYVRKRVAEYPDWGTQLDYIYHNGIEKWKTDIVDPVKSKYPKPN